MSLEHKPIDWTSKTDEEFVKDAETQIWFSAFAANNPRAQAHKEADAAWAEAKNRGKLWLYQRAWNKAYLSCGYQPSDSEIEAAKEPVE